MLPLSRNETHDTSTPLKPSTIDDMQDCIVGGRHGIKKITVPASSFRPVASSSQWASGLIAHQQDRDRWSFSSLATPGQTIICAPVAVPVGATIIKMKAFLNKASTAAVMGVLLRRDLPNVSTVAGETLVASINDASSGSTDIVVSVDLIHLVTDETQYQITASCGHTSQQFMYAQIWYWL